MKEILKELQKAVSELETVHKELRDHRDFHQTKALQITYLNVREILRKTYDLMERLKESVE